MNWLSIDESGNYGYKLDTDKEVEGLLKDIYDKKSSTRTPVTTGIQASYKKRWPR